MGAFMSFCLHQDTVVDEDANEMAFLQICLCEMRPALEIST